MPQIEVTLRQVGPSTTAGAARAHEILIDRPEAKGGEDRGPMGGEYMLMGVGGCFASNLLAAAKARDTPLEDLRIRVSAELVSGPARFSAVHLDVSAGIERQALEKLVTIADRACISMNTVRPALDLTVTVSDGAAVAG